ncbi:MepB family protein [Carboxylicivirga caseinilyticus]|uniref:MepB family protein n=1 Tax=Carboxylicivirga caseinilyticus TaxID=3417572 RepID=UPI003D335561|nr:MepB family protein [Marinilabiliaceae bacterium A049]
MDKNLSQIKTDIYDKHSLTITNFITEKESKEYDACRFQLNGRHIISRSAKITTKKNGQFVTFWKRINNSPIQPFNCNDKFDYLIVNTRMNKKLGQFVFPKSVLIDKGIISTEKREGKRAFRVYPKWDVAKSKQAQLSQQWQLNYFYEITNLTDLNRVNELYIGR